MIEVNGHFHADTVYAAIGVRHFVYLWWSLLVAKIRGGKSVNTHLPLEVMHPLLYGNLKWARGLIRFGEWWKRIFRIRLFWENAPLLKYGSWELLHGQMEWGLVPRDIDLCLDTGHLMLGGKSVGEARRRVEKILEERGGQIKHLHLHENDLVHDLHLTKLGRVLSEELIQKLKRGRSYIYEEGS